jgi:hypothetical protein
MPVFKTGAINHSANSPRRVLSVLHHFSRFSVDEWRPPETPQT